MGRLRYRDSIAHLRALYKMGQPSKKHVHSERAHYNPRPQQFYQHEQTTCHPSSSHHHRSSQHPPIYERPHYSHRRTRHEPPPNITTLPPELKHMIVSDLDPVTSVCLGLASKSYYDIHRDHHKRRIDLYEQAPERGRLPLVMYLRKWAGKYLGLDAGTGRFVRRDREFTDHRNRNGDGEQWDRERERGVKEIWGREGRLGRSKRYRKMDVGRYRW